MSWSIRLLHGIPRRDLTTFAPVDASFESIVDNPTRWLSSIALLMLSVVVIVCCYAIIATCLDCPCCTKAFDPHQKPTACLKFRYVASGVFALAAIGMLAVVMINGGGLTDRLGEEFNDVVTHLHKLDQLHQDIIDFNANVTTRSGVIRSQYQSLMGQSTSFPVHIQHPLLLVGPYCEHTSFFSPEHLPVLFRH
jgi:hypothetical protein